MPIDPNVYFQYLNQMPRGEKMGMLNSFQNNYNTGLERDRVRQGMEAQVQRMELIKRESALREGGRL